MFYGEYVHGLDKKDRAIIPAKFREIFKENFVEKFYVTRGLDKCLFVFTEAEWKNQERKFKEMPFTKSEARRFNRLYFSGACDVVCDKQGRILIPQYLKDYAGIQKNIVIVGVSDRIEIWAKEKWDEFFKTSVDSFEELAEKLV
ncbi:MAG: division/cell wall cluster transcriptional repressor MraZ [Candidatus Omnitrophica bacterium]|nr:division/cell wall cluster transcriptional repressor MraZ [Candidatus Omnitrophota bacterium]